MPDLNSLPPSPPPPSAPVPRVPRPRRVSFGSIDHSRPAPPSPRSPSLSSLQAAATINAGLHSPSLRSPPGLERRRSSLMNNFLLNDPTVPGPGEMQPTNGTSNSSSPRTARRSLASATADPHHQRQPSLGEIHQELESEQEAQVNRLLYMIRLQQDQLAALQRQQAQHPPEHPSPTSTEPPRLSTTPSSSAWTPAGTHTTDQSSPRSMSIPTLPSHVPHSHLTRPTSLSRQSSARHSTAGTNSRNGSPAARPVSGIGPLTEDFLLGGTRDECAFYQAETLNLTRENQMLKQRIRELERQVAELSMPGSTPGTAASHTPAHNSPLARSIVTLPGDGDVDGSAIGETSTVKAD